MAWHTSLFVFLSFSSIVLSLFESQVCDNEKLCDSEPTTGLKKCKYFDPAQFNEDSPSIVYGKITYTVHFFACDIYMYIIMSVWLWNFKDGWCKIFAQESPCSKKIVLKHSTPVMNYGSIKSAKIVLSKSIFYVKNQPNFFKKKFHLRISI